MNKKIQIRWLAFIITFALHNSEEIIRSLPAWAARHDVLPFVFSEGAFAATAILLTVLAATTGYVLERRNSPSSALILKLFCWIMIINAASHIAFSVSTWTLMPGVITSVLLLLPVCGWIVFSTPKRVRTHR